MSEGISVHCLGRVLVTGASRGIGLALTRLFDARGWYVIPMVRSISDMEQRVFEPTRYVVVDLSELDRIGQAVDSAAIGAIDVLLHVAGDFGSEAFTFTDFDHNGWERPCVRI
jgi:NAD(P)-dependent dehydrogenase (short-subunit alcohol dehydrogenase family)